ncbi:MAG: B12-binding domain-containing radical SAM protein [Clostridiales bacterium]|nr:B12-binding domain-containing radical SAM protein [Clostridiales bacterium]
MSVHFLFVYPDFLEDTKYVRGIPGNYSEGIASISATLKSEGHSVSLYHQTYMPDKREFIIKIKEFKPDIIGFSLRTTIMDCASEMLTWLNEELPDIPVIAGGYHPTLAPDEVIEIPGVDIVSLGEGEFPLRDLINGWDKTGHFNTSEPGFWFKQPDATVIRNAIRPYPRDLDELPFPDLDLFDYRNLKSNRVNTAEVIVSRGCLYSCTYCANANIRNTYADKKNYARFRSPENAIRLLEHVKQKDPNIEYLNFNDAILNMFTDWFYAFMKLYRERVNVRFTCNLRFDHIDEQMCRVLADSGCYLVTIGLENGNEAFHKKYLHRSMNNEHIIKVAQWLREAGISVYTYNIVGLPYETLALTLETIKLNARLQADNEIVSFFCPYPATDLRDISVAGGFLDPEAPLDGKVFLRLPGYPRRDIIYARYSFHRLVRAYRRIYSHPDPEKAKILEAALDKHILNPLLPRGFLGALRSLNHHVIVVLKRLAARFTPTVYKRLRQLKYRTH